jgi:DNA-binding CsgD family transcriptional regulator
VILWREKGKPEISEQTLAMMTALEPFLLFALTDLVARHQAERPIDRIFYDTIDEMAAEAQLSKQEKRIVILRLMGHSYKDLADSIHVSIDTIKKHLTQIHRKTATAGMAELFAKYFSARLIPTELRD